MKVYKLRYVEVERDWSLLMPEVAAVEIAGFWEEEVRRFVNHWFYGHTTRFGLTRHFVYLLMLKWMYTWHYVRGMSWAVAFAAAKVNFKAYVSALVAGIGWTALGIAAGVVVLGAVYAIMEWQELQLGRLVFPKGACVMRYEERFWWAAVVGHPAEHAWDFRRCYEIGERGFMEQWSRRDNAEFYDHWDFMYGWQEIEKLLVGWYTWAFGKMEIEYMGVAHSVTSTHYLIRQKEDARELYGYPVGWERSDAEGCAYIATFRDLYR